MSRFSLSNSKGVSEDKANLSAKHPPVHSMLDPHERIHQNCVDKDVKTTKDVRRDVLVCRQDTGVKFDNDPSVICNLTRLGSKLYTLNQRFIQSSRQNHDIMQCTRINDPYFSEYSSSYSFKCSHFSHTRWNRTFRSILIFIIGMLCLTGCNGDSSRCAAGLRTPGRTLPQGDIVLEYGKPLQITCILNKPFIDDAFPGKNASDLVFLRNQKLMEPEYITIVNETTITMYIENPPPAEDMYYCKLRLDEKHKKPYEGVCLNKVVIGFKPQEPRNFHCISYNWENISCSWEPVYNPVATTFTLVFKLLGRAGRKLYPCPVQKPQLPNTCLWDTSTNPIYRQSYEYYSFILSAENVLGEGTFQYKVHHFGYVIPARAANLTVVSKTSDSALLYWSVPFPMQTFPPGLHHRVTYQNQWDHQKTWQVINITNNLHVNKMFYNLTGLEYANAVYDVRVYMKSAVATGEDKWSNFSDVTFRTAPRLPGRAPRTDIGSFEISENNTSRDVYLYWQAIPQYLENGDNFNYKIDYIEENGRKLSLVPSETTGTYAMFKGISFNSYKFEIISTNIVGANKDRAKIFVPSQFEIPREPIAFTKIAFDDGLYELSWKPPVMKEEIVNYTIFWCDNERDRPYQCTGYLDWIHVPKNTTIYNMTVPDPKKVYQFAISANTKRASSGMVWASCTVIHNKVVGKMKSVWINRIGSDYIEVGWKLDCSDRIGIIEGFNIYYCPIVSPYNVNCKGPKLNTTIKADPHTIHAVVNGLKPYTTYMVAVAVLTKSGEGLHSEPLLRTTLEAAPTPPRDVKVVSVTNTTMFITWKTPEAMNGVLRYYEVYYNDLSEKVEEVNHLELTNLMAHQNYSISVAACTVACSQPSPTIHKVTNIGVPGKISMPRVRFVNSSQVVVMWSKPQNSAGYLDYYEIASSDGDIRNSTRTEAKLPIPDCKTIGREKLNQFRVRAVNIAPDNTHLKGPWSDAGEGNCYSDEPSFVVWVVIWIIGGLSSIATVLCLAYTTKRIWLKCKAMQDVEVKLPPGLAPNMKLLQKVGEQHTRQSSADSSGCSSGQESVTSSLTSDSQVSSDSGTEVDPAPVSPNKLLETPAWESSSLRQRNVGISRPGLTTETARWDPYVKVAKTGEPILTDTLSLARSTPNLTDNTSCANSQQTWSSTGYISMPSNEELSSNPSPVPKETTNIIGGYSVIGEVPRPLRSKSGDEGGGTGHVTEDSSSILKSDLKPVTPYITLASLEQKSKDNKKNIESLHNSTTTTGELTGFMDTKKLILDTLPTLSSTDKISKPYVQAGLMDSLKKPTKVSHIPATFASTSLTDSCNRPFVSSFVNPSLTDTVSKPYVTVASIADITKKSANNNKPPESSKPYVSTSVFQMLQQREKTETSESQKIKDKLGGKGDEDDEEDEEENDSSTIYPLCWQPSDIQEQNTLLETERASSVPSGKSSSGYVTIAENPKLDKKLSVVVPEKTVSQVTSGGQSDEPYSKVTVVPSTMQ